MRDRTTRPARRRPLAATVLAGSLGLLVGCGAPAVTTADLERTVGEELTASDSELAIDSLTCPDELPAEEGAETECTLVTDEGDEGTVRVTVSSVDGSTVNYEVVVSDGG